MKHMSSYNTLRNQILLLFVFVMSVVLLLVGVVTFQLVGDLIRDQAEAQMRQTAAEASGRMESLYEQLNLVSKQVATGSPVQQLLSKENSGQAASFQERQSVIQWTNELLAYSSGITAVELYTNDGKQLIPLGRTGLEAGLKSDWKQKADAEKGRIVWIGNDDGSPYDDLAIRRVNGIGDSFAAEGYLLVKVDKSYFQMAESNSREDGFMLLTDDVGRIVSTNYDMLPAGETDYMKAEHVSAANGWRLQLFTPETVVLKGLSVVRSAVAVSGLIGFMLFFALSYVLSTMLTKPIFELVRTMKKRRKGVLSLQATTFSTAEINELNEAYNEMASEINHLIETVYEKELLRSQTELKALQSQINPHFLFNTLNALYWALEDKDEELAEQVIAMSDLFRYTIEKEEWVTVKQEVQQMERYMQLMRLRIGDRFTWSVDVPAELNETTIPKLLIQPLVENALVHGISNKNGTGCVSVDFSITDDGQYGRVTITDNGKGMTKEQVSRLMDAIGQDTPLSEKSTGIAMVNVNKRLKLYYPEEENGGISISSLYGQGTVCTFQWPLKGGALHE